MKMHITFSVNGVPIRLPEERWKEHIIFRHPELKDSLGRVLETIGKPDLIQQGDVGTLLAIKQFNDKYVVLTLSTTKVGRFSANAEGLAQP